MVPCGNLNTDLVLCKQQIHHKVVNMYVAPPVVVHHSFLFSNVQCSPMFKNPMANIANIFLWSSSTPHWSALNFVELLPFCHRMHLSNIWHLTSVEIHKNSVPPLLFASAPLIWSDLSEHFFTSSLPFHSSLHLIILKPTQCWFKYSTTKHNKQS